LKEWIDAQPGNATFRVLFALLARLLDSGLAKRVARKYKVNPSAWGYVKMTQDSLFSPSVYKVTRRIRQPANNQREKGET
jgi:hypothetical protein